MTRTALSSMTGVALVLSLPAVPAGASPAMVAKAKERATRPRAAGTGVAPVRWRVNCFRNGHGTSTEGDTEIAPPGSIVDPEGTGRSSVWCARSNIMGDR